jgi:hypothetical protein
MAIPEEISKATNNKGIDAIIRIDANGSKTVNMNVVESQEVMTNPNRDVLCEFYKCVNVSVWLGKDVDLASIYVLTNDQPQPVGVMEAIRFNVTNDLQVSAYSSRYNTL